MDIGKRIRSIREAMKLTQEQVANGIGLDNSSYARIEKQGKKISIEKLEKIAGALGVSVVELITGEAQKGVDSEEVERLRSEVQTLKKDKVALHELLDFYREFKEIVDFYKEYKKRDSEDKQKGQNFLKEYQSKKFPKGYELSLSETLMYYISDHILEKDTE